MKFEYDPINSELNRQKHGISLEEAKELWEAPGVEIPARKGDEPRFLRVGIRSGKFYSCIYTMRGDTIRLISRRRSWPDEEKVYQERVKHEKAEE